MKGKSCHIDKMVSLKRVEGQIRGIQRMIEQRKYCTDILTQIQAAKAALNRVEEEIMARCLTKAIGGAGKAREAEQVITLWRRFRKIVRE